MELGEASNLSNSANDENPNIQLLIFDRRMTSCDVDKANIAVVEPLLSQIEFLMMSVQELSERSATIQSNKIVTRTIYMVVITLWHDGKSPYELRLLPTTDTPGILR